MQGTRSNIARNKQLLAKDVAEKALFLSIENADLDADTIKALRLTCKRTKVAADVKVKEFTMSEKQEPGDVQRSGLLKTIRKLSVNFVIYDISEIAYWKLSNSLALLKLAVEICSKSLEVLNVYIMAESENLLSCAEVLGTATWESLKQLKLRIQMPGLLPAFLANPGSLPALQSLVCFDPSAPDLEFLHNAAFFGSLEEVNLSYLRTPVVTAAAMRSLVQKATNLKALEVGGRTFEFFDSEQLASLQSLRLSTPHLIASSVSLAPALARPWMKLHTLSIRGIGTLQGPDLVRIFEAEDTLPVLKSLRIEYAQVTVDALSCVRRPFLEEFHLIYCRDGHKLISKLAQLMKEDRNALANLKKFYFNCTYEMTRAGARKAVSEFLSCPQMAALESLNIVSLGRQEAAILSSDIEKYCPNLKRMELS